MSTPFQCLCGSSQCLKRIAGARYLSLNVLGRYFINQHIWSEVETYFTTSVSDDLYRLSKLGLFAGKNFFGSTANFASSSKK